MKCAPSPILLNCHKHHLGFLRLRCTEVESEDAMNSIINELKQLGNSKMDVYTGQLSPENIASEVFAYLKEQHLETAEKYGNWIKNKTNGFHLHQLSDKSIWVLRCGIVKDRFVHLHPARKSAETIRANAMTLKTAVATAAYQNWKGEDINLQLVNDVREKYFGESPLHRLEKRRGVGKIINLLN